MAQIDPWDFEQGPIEAFQAINPIIVVVDVVGTQFVSEEAHKKLSQALHELTRAIIDRAYRAAVEATYSKYPFTPIQPAHIESAVSKTILSLADVMNARNDPEKN